MTWISSVGLAKTNEKRPIREAMAQSLDVGGVSLAVITATGVARRPTLATPLRH